MYHTASARVLGRYILLLLLLLLLHQTRSVTGEMGEIMHRVVVCCNGESTGEPQIMSLFVSCVSTAFRAHDRSDVDERHIVP